MPTHHLKTMATKRQAPDDHGARSKRPRYTNPNKPASLSGKKSFKKAHPVNELKSQVRSLKRLLERELPANVRVEKERALETATSDLANAEKAKKKSEIIGRWHKIRFFDRQKAERRLKKARKALSEATSDDDDKDIEAKRRVVEEYEVDVNYAMYYPLELDYAPLFPTKRKKEGENAVEGAGQDEEKGMEERQGDKELWELVKRCMADGTLQDLREGRLMVKKEEVEDEGAGGSSGFKAGRVRREMARKVKADRDKEDHDDNDSSDDEDGAGFFEAD